MLADRESARLAKRLIAETCSRQHIPAGQLTLHADRGSSMKSKLVAQLLADLSVTKTHSRPHVSNDNPYSESHFKTMKYRPDFPSRFGSREDAMSFCRGFFDWYNNAHHHSGLHFLTPAQVHRGEAGVILARRQATLDRAFAEHPERFPNGVPRVPTYPRRYGITHQSNPNAHLVQSLTCVPKHLFTLPLTPRKCLTLVDNFRRAQSQRSAHRSPGDACDMLAGWRQRLLRS